MFARHLPELLERLPLSSSVKTRKSRRGEADAENPPPQGKPHEK